MAFADTWNSTYETIPQDTDQESLGAGTIRDLKVNVRQRLQTDHSLNGDQNDGMHEAITMVAQSADPAPAPLSGTSVGSFYSKVVGAFVELFYKNAAGVSQLTNGGTLQGVPPGTIIDVMDTVVPAGYLEANGQAVSRTGFPALNAVASRNGYANGYGPGDGSTTFNVPNCNGKVRAGRNGSFSFGNVSGSTGGEYSHQMTLNELVAHIHPANDSGHTHPFTAGISPQNPQQGGGGSLPCSASPAGGTTGTGTANITVGSTGGSAPFNIVQPTLVVLTCIKY